MLIAALFICRDSPGPALFSQRRIGRGGSGFVMWKFRTMQQHAPDVDHLMQATRHDRRVTRTGAFLRRYSLDEFPQLYNVLRGEMSLVGAAAGTHPEPAPAASRSRWSRRTTRPGTGCCRGSPAWRRSAGWWGETDTQEKLLRRVDVDPDSTSKTGRCGSMS